MPKSAPEPTEHGPTERGAADGSIAGRRDGFVPHVAPVPLSVRAAPIVFVVLWASGFIVARTVRPYAEAETFVSLRFAFSGVVLAAVATLGHARWPRSPRVWRDSLIAGVLMQGIYIGGVFWAVKHGLPAAVAALITGLQPLLTGMLAGPLLGERVSARRWTGIALGFCGAVLVLLPNLQGAGAVSPAAVGAGLGAMVSITLGTIWQKRIGAAVDLRAGAAIQFIGGLLVTAPLALATEPIVWPTHPYVWGGLAYAVVVLSVLTTLLLLTLIGRGAVAAVTSLFYLVPPITALMALVVFGEGLDAVQIVGMTVAAIGVAVANRG